MARRVPLLGKARVLTQPCWPQRSVGDPPQTSLSLRVEPMAGSGLGQRGKGLLASPNPNAIFPGTAASECRGLSPACSNSSS